MCVHACARVCACMHVCVFFSFCLAVQWLCTHGTLFCFSVHGSNLSLVSTSSSHSVYSSVSRACEFRREWWWSKSQAWRSKNLNSLGGISTHLGQPGDLTTDILVSTLAFIDWGAAVGIFERIYVKLYWSLNTQTVNKRILILVVFLYNFFFLFFF